VKKVLFVDQNVEFVTLFIVLAVEFLLAQNQVVRLGTTLNL